MTVSVHSLKPVKLKDAYLELLSLYPLRPIRHERDYSRAIKVLESLVLREDLDADQQGYLDTLAMLVHAYEEEHYDFGPDTRTPLERLQYLMSESGMSVTKLGQIIGSQPAASMILNGKRQLSKTHIRKLSEYFKLDAGYFL